MKPTIEGSVAFDIACMSFEKEKEKELKVIKGREANISFDEDMAIKAENGVLRENNILQSENGKIIEFEDKAFEKVKQNRKSKEQIGIALDYAEKVVEMKKKRATSIDKDANIL